MQSSGCLIILVSASKEENNIYGTQASVSTSTTALLSLKKQNKVKERRKELESTKRRQTLKALQFTL